MTENRIVTRAKARLESESKGEEFAEVGTYGTEEDMENLSELIKQFAAKMDRDEANKNAITVESFGKIIPEYNGCNIPIRQWFVNFDQNAEAYELNDKQKYVNARNKMTGMAKLFLESVTVSTYETLRNALFEEFDKKLSSADVHKLLMARKKRDNEDFHEYVLQMRKLAAMGDVEDQSTIRYIVDGLRWKPELTFPLYSAATFSELRQRHEIIDMANGRKSNEPNCKEWKKRGADKMATKSEDGGNTRKQHCYNCGSAEHKRAECKMDTKCFKCNGSGHIAKQCDKNVQKSEVNIISNKTRAKQMKINNQEFSCLVDTGSDVTLIQESVYKSKFGDSALQKSSAVLYGLGNIPIRAIGTFTAEIDVDNLKSTHKFLIVPDSTINYGVIIGYDFIEKFTLVLKGSTYSFLGHTADKVEIEAAGNNVYNVVSATNDIDVPMRFKATIEKIISEYKPVNASQECPIKLKIIPSTESIAFRQSAARLSLMEHTIVENQVREWLSQGVIRESSSEVASRVVLAKKKDGSYRVCIDYRTLNACVLKDRFPIPIIDDILSKMQNSKFFTVMDLKNGFFHVPIEEGSKKYTAFITKQGLYEFNRAPFGFCNSPAVFSRYVNHIFQKLIKSGIMELYVDDIVVFGQTAEDCLLNVRKVLDHAQCYGLEIKWSKCQFLKEKIDFLGHTVQNGSVRPGETKIKAVKNFPVPKCVRSVQAFLGLTGYFRKFVKQYATIARPLTNLLKKEVKFHIGEAEMRAIKELKAVLMQEPVLKIFKQNAETQLHVDASKHGFGGTLMQRHGDTWHPVLYWSKKTSASEEKMNSYMLEVKAAYMATKKFRQYLLGNTFELITDCAAFKQTTTKRDMPREVAQWIMYLQDFSFTVEHRAGSRMKHVDTLSRYPVLIVQSELRARLQKAQQSDEHLKAVREILKERQYENFKIVGDLLYKHTNGQDLLVLPRCMEHEVITNAHNIGHMGTQKTMHAIQQEYFIPHLEKKVSRHIANCVKCITHNRKSGKQEDFLHCIDKGQSPLQTVHVDHLGPMDATTKCYKYIFAIVDAFSKFTWLFTTKSTEAQEVVKHMQTWMDVFGSPERIVSDKGTAFTSNMFKQLCADNNIEHIEITTGVARGNGQIERVNRVILSVLAKLSHDEPAKWYKYTGQVQKAINGHVHSSTKHTPFEVLFGFNMRHEFKTDLIKILKDELIECLNDDRKALRQSAREQITKAQEVYKKQYDKKRKSSNDYRVSDLVAIKYTQFIAGKKLASKYIGPYKIVKVKRNCRYDVEKAADFLGPNRTSTSSDNIKLWRYIESNDDDLSSEADEDQDDRV